MASVHSGGSIRNDAQAKRKVFKNVLGSPFVMKWPAIPDEVGQSVLTHLITLLEPIGTIRRENTKKKKKEKKQEEQNEQQTSYPEIYKRLRTGNNTITELLEKIIQDNNNKKEGVHHHPWTIFVCKRDIQPTQLCNHLLPMCTMAKTKLVPLPEGSVVKIGQALNIPRVSVLALQIKEDNDTNNKEEERLRLAVEEVPKLAQTQWLDDATSYKGNYHPTNVKVIQTTAPIKQPKQQPKKQPQQQQQQNQNQNQQKRQDRFSDNNQPNKKIKR